MAQKNQVRAERITQLKNKWKQMFHRLCAHQDLMNLRNEMGELILRPQEMGDLVWTAMYEALKEMNNGRPPR